MNFVKKIKKSNLKSILGFFNQMDQQTILY